MLPRTRFENAEKAIIRLAREGFAVGDVQLALFDGRPVVWGMVKDMPGEDGPVAMAIYERIGLSGSGLTVKLTDPIYHMGGARYLMRTVSLALAEEVFKSDDPMIGRLERVESVLNKKGWSMG